MNGLRPSQNALKSNCMFPSLSVTSSDGLSEVGGVGPVVVGLGDREIEFILGSLDLRRGGERPDKLSNISSRRMTRRRFLIQLVISLLRFW